MKKKRINLFENQTEYQKIERLFYYFRISTFLLLFVFLLTFFVSNFKLIADKRRLEQLFNQKKYLLETSRNQTVEEAKINLIKNKYLDIQLFLNEDAHFLPYYSLLAESLKFATPEPTLLTFKIDKEKNTEFKLGFSTFNQMVSFLTFIEKEDFLNKFETIVLEGFSTIESKMELSFKGKFISLKNENF